MPYFLILIGLLIAVHHVWSIFMYRKNRRVSLNRRYILSVVRRERDISSRSPNEVSLSLMTDTVRKLRRVSPGFRRPIPTGLRL